MRVSGGTAEEAPPARVDGLRHAVLLLGTGIVYFGLAKAGLTLASINPSATPIWPPTGFALAATMLFGGRIWPAIFAGALLANLAAAGPAAAAAIAAGNTGEALLMAALLRRRSGGAATFASAAGVARFAAICVCSGPVLSASVGVAALLSAGLAAAAEAVPVWITWWLGDAAGALVVTPVLVLWATEPPSAASRDLLRSGLTYAGAAAVGMLALGPPADLAGGHSPLAFLAILPLMWAAGRCGRRDTATVALILAGFAVWGAIDGGGPFQQETLNASFLLLLTFLIAVAVPSLALAADIALRRQVERELSRRREELEALFGQALVGILELDADARVLVANDRFAGIVQRPADGLLRQRLHDLLVPEDRVSSETAFAGLRRSGAGYVLEASCPRPAGGLVRLRCQVAPIRDAAGRLRRAVAVCEDVTAQHEAEARQRLLIAELDHRVRNSFATILSMARLALPGAPDKEAYAAALEARVAAMARTHGLLTQRQWAGAPLQQIVKDELVAYAGADEVRIAGPDCLLRPKPALDIALVLHELATNAAKYGALSVPQGRVSVTWRIEQTAEGSRLRLCWQETGGPPVTAPARAGFGTRLVRTALAGNQGSSELEFRPEGVRCEIALPLGTAGDVDRRSLCGG